MDISDRKIVLGLGNTLNRDEGLGVHALKVLEETLRLSFGEQIPVELLDGGTLGLNLLMLVEEASHLLVLDAINAGKPPGTLIELKRDDIPLFRGIKMSEHQVSFQEVLGLAKIRGRLPEHLRLIGVQPADISIGVEPSPVIAATFPKVVARSIACLKDWGLLG
jgi:hydrogenase maturation protease